MPLRIAQIGPLWENIPPEKYGGTEWIVHSVTEGLIKKGHDVTLFACGTSTTSAKLVSVYPRPLIQDGITWTNIMYPLLNLTEAFDRHAEFDILHVHLNKSSDFMALPLAKEIKDKVIFTLHFPYPLSRPENDKRPDQHLVLQKYKDMHFVSISNSQRRGGENLNWAGTVYNGIEIEDFTFNPDPQDYFLWLGKINPDKGTKNAILAAKKAGIKLLVAGAIDSFDSADYKYYLNEVKPLFDDKQIIYVGEANLQEKNKLYREAKGFLNPIQWNEPFGLVMAESMATGTPVIAFRQGAAPEIIVDGENGYIVDTIDEMVEKIPQIGQIDRKKCRERILNNFTAEKMVDGYENVYNTILQNR